MIPLIEVFLEYGSQMGMIVVAIYLPLVEQRQSRIQERVHRIESALLPGGNSD